MDIRSSVVEIYLALNIFGIPPFEIQIELKVEDLEGYQIIHSAIQSKQGIIIRNEQIPRILVNLSTDSLSSLFFSIKMNFFIFVTG